MCLSIPAEIIEIDKDQAKVSVSGNLYSANISLLEDVKVGDYILLHAGFGIQKISDEEAGEVLELLMALRGKR
jgi:hydrogenase expression/formation protein HypC